MQRRTHLALFLPALTAVPLAAGLGVARGLWRAREVVHEQGYADLGFARATFMTYRDGAQQGLSDALPWAWYAAGVAFAVGCVLFLVRESYAPDRWVALVASRAARARVTALVSAAAILFLFALEREKSWVAASDIVFAFGLVVAFSGVFECIGSYASSDAFAQDPRRRATVAAAVVAVFLLLTAGAWINRELLAHPRDPETWLFDGLLVITTAAVFAALRRRALDELQGLRSSPWSHPATAGALAGIALTALALALPTFEGQRGAPTLTAKRPHNVLLIGIDTLRADATSIYGSSLRGRDTTPNLRKLAERGIAFSNAVSQAPWTMPSFASMITGAYPHEHGAFSLAGAIPDRRVLLSEVLREAGYRTSGVVSHSYVAEHRGFAQGFERYDASNALGHRAITSKSVTDLSIEALEARGDHPFFHFAHYFDAHYEYMDQPEWTWADGYQGWLRRELDYDNLLKNRQLIGRAENEWLIDLYEEEIAHTDAEIGRLLAWLDDAGVADETLVIVVADHGEEFLDHGSFGHTTTLYQEQVHVPLIVAPAGWSTPCVFRGVVETRAIFGTVLDALDVDFGQVAREHSLLRRVGPGCAELGASDAKAFSIVWLPDSQLEWGKHMRISAVREGRWKLIRDFTRETTMLFDVEADPGEKHDLAAGERENAQRLGSALEAWTAEQQRRGGEAHTVSVDADELKKLKELGYL